MTDNTNTEISFSNLLGLENGGEFILGDTTQVDENKPLVLDTVIPTSTENPDLEEKVIIIPGESPDLKNTIAPEKEAVEKPEPNYFTTIAKKFIAEGDWEDVQIEDENGNLVKLSEIDNLDEETFLAIKEDHKKLAKEDIEKNYISVKELPEEKLRLLNIIKNGGDLKEIFKSEEGLKKPFEGMDLNDDKNKASILYWQYTQKQGLEAGEAKDLVDAAIKNLTLDSKVTNIVDYYQENHKKRLVEIEQQVIAEKAAEEASIKEYKKNLSTLYKKEGITDSVSKRLIEAATVRDETGDLVIDSVYENIMKDPEKAKDLIFFMLEQEAFLKAKGANIKTQEQIGLLRTVKIVRDTGGKSSSPEIKEEPKNKNPFGEVVLEQ